MAVCSSSFNISNISELSNACASTGQYAFNMPLQIKSFGSLTTTKLEQGNPASLSVFSRSPDRGRGFRIQCIGSEATAKTISGLEESECDNGSRPLIDRDGGGGGGADDGGGGSGSGGGGGNGDEGRDGEEEEFGPLLKFVEIMKVAEDRGVKLPSDMMEAAKTTGIREMFLLRYLELQVNSLLLFFLTIFWLMKS